MVSRDACGAETVSARSLQPIEGSRTMGSTRRPREPQPGRVAAVLRREGQEKLFEANDVDVLSHAVTLVPELELACYAAKLARARLAFPVRSLEALAPLFKNPSALPDRIRRRGITSRQLAKYFPKAFFPIEDVADFLGKALAAIQWGEAQHHHERAVAAPERFHRFVPPMTSAPGEEE